MIILFLYCVWFFSSNNPKRNNLERNKNVKGILKNNYKSNTYTCSIVVKWGTNFSFILTLHVYMFLLMIKWNGSKLYIRRNVNNDTKNRNAYQINIKSSLLINLNKRSKHPCKWNILLEIYFRNITRKETCKTIYVVGIIFFFYGKLSVNCVLQKGLI